VARISNRKDPARQSRNQNLEQRKTEGTESGGKRGQDEDEGSEQKKTKGTKIPFAESPFSPLPPVQSLFFAFRFSFSAFLCADLCDLCVKTGASALPTLCF